MHFATDVTKCIEIAFLLNLIVSHEREASSAMPSSAVSWQDQFGMAGPFSLVSKGETRTPA